MNELPTLNPRTVAPGVSMLTSHLPVPGFGVLPVNAFVIASPEPVLVDTGLAAARESFLEGLESIVNPSDLRWIWITHTDADHVGNLAEVVSRAPEARVVTTYLGMGKMAMLGLPTDRVYLLNPGQSLDVGDRRLHAVVPPTFDAPETTALFDDRHRTLFSADCFGALMEAPADLASDVSPPKLRQGLGTWATVDAPWLNTVDSGRFERALASVERLAPDTVLSSHLPPAAGMTDTLLETLRAAAGAPPFVGPDQAELERLMAAA